ncbi:MAG: MarC family protein [Limisphaerales bacterium]
MTSPLEFALLTFSSLFAIVNPLGNVPVFLAMTGGDPPAQRRRTIRIAAMAAAVTLLVFAYTGSHLFRLLGITPPAFQCAACLVLLLIALDMLRAQRSPVQSTREEADAGAEKTEVAITPLAIPMLAGPGAITTTILFQKQAGTSLALNLILCGSIVAVAAVTWGVLRLSLQGAGWLSPIALRVITRVMGLLLAALAFQFGLNAIREFRATL